MGLDVRWIVNLKTPRPDEEWRMIQAIQERLDDSISPRVASTRNGNKRTLIIYSRKRWVDVSPRVKASPLHIPIAEELEILKELAGDLRIYYSHDNRDTPGDYLTEGETHDLLDQMTLVTDGVYMSIGLMADAARAADSGG